jgi:hypothetical protein
MTDRVRTIDRTAARLTRFEPRPDVRARVLASIADAPRVSRLPRRLTVSLAAATAVVVCGALSTLARRPAHVDTPPPARVASNAAAVQTPIVSPDTAVTRSSAKPKRAKKPAPPDFVTPGAAGRGGRPDRWPRRNPTGAAVDPSIAQEPDHAGLGHGDDARRKRQPPGPIVRAARSRQFRGVPCEE